MMQRITLLVLALASIASADLKVGDRAPSIAIDQWVKGDRVDGFEKNRVYVVEFWATWCGPCIAGIPHLSELQEKYDDDLTVIGVSTQDTRGNNLGSVQQLVQAQGNRMDYTVAFTAQRTMWNDWMAAAGRNGIPSAFLVGVDGTIEWIGHPMSIDGALQAAVAKVDRSPAAVDSTESKEAIVLKQRIQEALDAEDSRTAIAAMSRLIRIDEIRYAGWAARRIGLLTESNERATITQVRETLRRTYKDNPGESAWVIATVLRSDKAGDRLIESVTPDAERLSDLDPNSDPRLKVLAAEMSARDGDAQAAMSQLAAAQKQIEDSKLHKEVKAQLNEEITARLAQLSQGAP